MTDEETLKEIDRQEKRFAAAKYSRGLQLAKSAREYYQTIVKCRQKSAEAAAKCAAAQKWTWPENLGQGEPYPEGQEK